MKSGISTIFRRITALCITALMLAKLTSCGPQEVKKNHKRPSGRLSTGNVVQNGDYTLFWDDDAGCIVMNDTKTGIRLSDILYSEYLSGNIGANTGSSIMVSVIDTTTLSIDTLRSYAEIEENGRIYSEKIDGGIRVTYSFNSYSIAVPVDYILREDSLLISIDGSAVIEGGDRYKLVSVSVAPYLCHTKNGSEDSYLFVPSGSGALMYTYEDADGTRKYSGEVYGDDASRRVAQDYTDGEAIRLPVFGSKYGDSAVLGIIEQGAGAALIEAQAGYARVGYSNVYPTFYLRGYDVFRFGSYATGNNITTRVSDDITQNTVSVAYYPLTGSEADYNGMARRYRRYLTENGNLGNQETDSSPYSATSLGGTQVSSSTLGFPTKKLRALTTFKQAADMITEMKKDNGAAPAVRLSAFSDEGLSFGEISGGRSFDSVYGTKKDYRALINTAESIFTDFELIRYTKSGNGFSYRTSAAKTAIHYLATQYEHSPLRLFDETKEYRILSRRLLDKALEAALKKAESYGTAGMAFSSLGEYAYSDYCSNEYSVKYGMEEQVSGLLKNAGENHKTAVAGGNAYAACAADTVFDVPIGNGDYNVLDAEIPFYQMVFHSYRPLYSTAINYADNAKRAVMLAASGGMGLGFTVAYDYLSDSTVLSTEKLYAAKYSDNRTLITQLLKDDGYAELYTSVADAEIVCYELLDSAVSKTVFANGTAVYANHSDKTVQSPAGILEGYGFAVDKGEII